MHIKASSLIGLVTQIAGLKDALGDEYAQELIRGCKVNIYTYTMHSITKILSGILQLYS